ncbi:MAG: POTRA domain-containing protein [Candidatus Cloacimonetes bacterium]|nr:POTRA domain-containing protein [Candidatus Cloacimonadota bacterium]
MIDKKKINKTESVDISKQRNKNYNKMSLFNTLRILLLTIVFCIEFVDFSAQDTEQNESFQYYVEEIIFSGNNYFSDDELINHINLKEKTSYDLKSIYAVTEQIMQKYISAKFFFAEVYVPEIEPLDNESFRIIFTINELISESLTVLIKGNNYLSSQYLSANLPILKEGRIDIEEVSDLIINLIELYVDNGFFFASAEIGNFSRNVDGDYSVEILVDEGRVARFQSYRFRGNKVTKDKTILKISGIKHAKKITPDVLEQISENIRKREYITDCKVLPLNSSELLFDITEGRMTSISGIIGYENKKNDSSALTGFVKIKLMNLFGTDRTFGLNWQKIADDRSLIELTYSDPGVFDIPVAGDFSVKREVVDSTYIRTSFDTKLFYFTLRNKYGLYYGVDDYNPGVRRPVLIDKRSKNKIGAFWEFSKIDYSPNPANGFYSNIMYYFLISETDGKKNVNEVWELDFEHYKSISPKFVLALLLHAKGIEQKAFDELELFNLGGASSLRGFTENRFIGNRIGWLNAELRLLTNRYSRFFIFVDYGYVELERVNEKVKLNNLWSTGFGMRIKTKIGILGIDYGFGSEGVKIGNPLDGLIHFGMETQL